MSRKTNKRIVLYIDYEESAGTSYELEEWVSKSFGDKEVKEEYEEIRDLYGNLKQLKVVINV